ncbi:MAG: T9SS type A sorting domain-containing protein [Bacteroidota bacterium]|nr:T9SS type A sorting domain-containing protein [Bacteroidota bacterium]
MKKHSLIILSVLIILPLSLKPQNTFYVPSQYSSIQAAVNVANDGDIIDIIGIITESNIVVKKSLVIRGHGPDSTIIQAGSTLSTTNGGVFLFLYLNYYNKPVIFLKDLTVRHGSPTYTPHCGGGGIYNTVVLHVDNCVIKNNQCRVGTWNYGGGICNEHILYLRNSVVRNNSCNGGSWAHGGGISTDGKCYIENSSICNNVCTNAKWHYGAGIRNNGVCNITNSTFKGNTNTTPFPYGWKNGSAISNHEYIEILNSTFSENTGGSTIYQNDFSQGISYINNSTIVNNNGGIDADYGNLILKNTIIANPGYFDCSGNIISDGYNVVLNPFLLSFNQQGDTTGVNPNVKPIGDYGGPTETFAIDSTSVAFNRGVSENTFGRNTITDQRGYFRGAICDIGAFEANPYNLTTNQNMEYVCMATDDVVFMEVIVSDTNNVNDFLNKISFSKEASIDPANVKNLRFYFTGNVNTFNYNQLVGNSYSSIIDSFTFIDSVSLQKGLNYFWLVGDVSNSAQGYDSIDFKCNLIEINNQNVAIGITSPALTTIVQSEPFIIQGISDTFACQQPGSIVFSPVVGGTDPLHYKWIINNNNTVEDTILTWNTYHAHNPVLIRFEVSNSCSVKAINSFFLEVKERPQTPVIILSPNDSVCDGDSITLSAPSSVGYLWSNNNTNSWISLKSDSSLYLQVIDKYGCFSDTSYHVHLKFIDKPEKPTITNLSYSAICQGQSTAFKVDQDSMQYIWSNGSKKRIINVDDTAKYWVKTINDFGCLSPASEPLSIVIYPLPPKPQINILGNDTLCEGDTSYLQVPSGYNLYKWNPLTNIDSSIVQVSLSGNYFVKVMDTNNCYSPYSDTIKITKFLKLPKPQIISDNDFNYCENDSIFISSLNQYYLYQWSNSKTSQSFYTHKSDSLYLIGYNDFGCKSDTSEIVFIIQYDKPVKPEINLTGSPQICDGDSVLLCTSTGYRYYWSNGLNNHSIVVDSSGAFYVYVQDTNDCFSDVSDTVYTHWHPTPNQPVLNITGDSTTCEGEVVNLFPLMNNESYIWSNGDSSKVLAITEDGSYNLIVGNEYNCFSEVSEGTNIYFTPTPLKPSILILSNDYLHCTVVGEHYYWYRNDSLLNIDTFTIKANIKGNYSVQIQDGICLSEFSDTLFYIPSGIDEVINNEVGIEVYPNPSLGVFNLKLTGINPDKVQSIKIIDTRNRLVYMIEENQLTDINIKLDLSANSNGIYLLKIITESAMYFEKIIKY